MELIAYSAAVATVGDNFKRIREAKKLKQEQLYRSLGYKRPSNVSLLERSRRLPKAPRVILMARVLDCRASELLTDVETEYDRIRAGAYDHDTLVRETEQLIKGKTRAAARRAEKKAEGKRVAKP